MESAGLAGSNAPQSSLDRLLSGRAAQAYADLPSVG